MEKYENKKKQTNKLIKKNEKYYKDEMCIYDFKKNF